MMPPEAFPVAEPYIGPRSFERGESRLFFGRDREAVEIPSLVIAHPEVVLHAPSGAGKTSLLNAGVIPRLEDEFGCEVLPSARMLGSTGGMPLQAIRNIFSFAALVSWADEDTDPDRLSGMTLRDYLRDREHRIDEYGEAAVRVAIFDQFEEVFIAHPERWRDRRGFFEEIRASLDDDPMLRVVFSIREDRIAELEPYASLLPGKLRLRYRLEPFRRDSALEAIVLPLRATGRQFVAGVAERIVDEMMRLRIPVGGANATGGSLGGEPVGDEPGRSFPPEEARALDEFVEPMQLQVLGEFVEPVQLQIIGRGLWERLDPDQVVITERDVEAFDVDQPLTAFYDRCVRDAARAVGLREGDVRRWIEEGLITSAGTRALMFWDPIGGGPIPREVLVLLDERHLIRAERRGRDTWYELAHDRWVEIIRASNWRWRAGRSTPAQHQLVKSAEEWGRDRRPDRLLSGADLTLAEDWMAGPDAAELGYSAQLADFVRASRHEAERRRSRVLRRLVVGLTILNAISLLSLAAAIWVLLRR